ncbi:aspartate/glutamate racemase family protein [Lentibacillus sediminis]|uniref:aspartate/glutamate racemase family protein n=1 Tax=Lentibacillus sediminis TaxID=1940529 RepID=UPI000C1BB710|nr:aspartate/glutamate racemase family protein [Lentibacillus sediminis]
MSTKIGLVHATMNSVQPILHAFHTYHPSVDLINVMDEGLIYELNETNTITQSMIRRLMDITGKAEDAGADAILLTCSSFSPYVPEITHLFGVPTLSSDESMLDKAVEIGGRISVIATVEKAGPTTTNLLYKTAEEKGKKIDVNTVVLPEAFQALQKANQAKHDELIHAEIDKLSKESDAVVLAQYSMASSLDSYERGSTPILTGPEVSANAIVKLAEKG